MNILSMRGKHKPELSHRLVSTREVNTVDASHRELNLGIVTSPHDMPADVPSLFAIQDLCQQVRKIRFAIFLSNS